MACEDSGEEGAACSQCRAQGVDHLDKKGWGGVGWGVECRESARRQYKLYSREGQFNKGQGGRGYRGCWVHPALVCTAGVNSLKGTAEVLGCVSQFHSVGTSR